MVCVSMILLAGCEGTKKPTQTPEEYTPVAPAFNADSAFAYVEKQCEFGPRVTGTEAHAQCGAWLSDEFTRMGAVVTEQKATFTLYDGKKVSGLNIIASYNPEAQDRLIICAHWDSRPWADHDLNDAMHHTPIDGANDGASGVAVLLELARLMQNDNPNIGVDLICFDAEDCGTPEWDESDGSHEHTWCLGSQYWAEHHHTEGYTANCAILLDMVGGQGARFYQEVMSKHYAGSIVDKVWRAASVAGFSSFFLMKEGTGITDDHIPVNTIAKIPCIDIIPHYPDCRESSFGPTWHTVNDDMAHIDRSTLQAVGQTIIQVLFSEQ